MKDWALKVNQDFCSGHTITILTSRHIKEKKKQGGTSPPTLLTGPNPDNTQMTISVMTVVWKENLATRQL